MRNNSVNYFKFGPMVQEEMSALLHINLTLTRLAVLGEALNLILP